MRPRALVPVVAALLAALVAGCSGGSGSSLDAPKSAAGANGASGGGSSGGGSAARFADQGAARGEPAGITLAPRDRSVIYTAELTVRVHSVAAAAERAASIVADAGGYTSREQSARDPGDDRRATARLTLKVPVERYPRVLDQLSRRLGDRLELHRRAQDVTETVADVDSRVHSARATIRRLRALLGQAVNVSEVLKVERELGMRQADLEALEARQQALDSSTSYATVSLRLQRPPGATAVEKAGFVTGLVAGWSAFRATVVWLLTALGAAAPFLLIFGGLGYGGWRGYRFLRRPRSGRTGSAGPPAPPVDASDAAGTGA